MTGVTVLSVPFHLDEPLPGFAPPVPPDEVIAPDLPPGPPWKRMAELYAEVADAIDDDELQVVLSGDCTTSLAVVAGLQRSGVDPALVWFDAHGDLQTPQTSASGYLGGFPLRQLVGGADRTVPEALGLRPLPESDVLLVDARDLDPPEAEFLAGSAIRHVAVDAVLDALPDGPVHLHLDADVVDPRDLPGLLFPAPGGPRWAEVLGAVRAVLATCPVVAVTVGCTWKGQGPPEFAALIREIADSAR
jgi:arginase